MKIKIHGEEYEVDYWELVRWVQRRGIAEEEELDNDLMRLEKDILKMERFRADYVLGRN